MTKCSYCNKNSKDYITLVNFILYFRKVRKQAINFKFCSKECLMSFLSERCREAGIKSREEEVWNQTLKNM